MNLQAEHSASAEIDQQPGRTKRSAAGSNNKPTRSKRARYVNRACNICAQRKLRCNGENPCDRCLTQDDRCAYATTASITTGATGSNEFERVDEEVSLLRQQMDRIMRQGIVGSNRENATPEPVMLTPCSVAEPVPQPVPLSTNGPTSNNYALRMAEGQLRTLGIGRFESISMEERGLLQDEQPLRPWFPAGASEHLKTLVIDDPLWQMELSVATNLITGWENGLGAMFPIIPPTWLHKKWAEIHTALQLLKTTAIMPEALAAVEELLAREVCLLKMVLANTLTAQTSGPNEMAKRLFESVKEARERALQEPPTLTNVSLLALVGILHYHLGDQMQGSRVVASALRLCLELGLHRTDISHSLKTNATDRLDSTSIFWSVYVIERRMSTSLGVPYILQDADIDDSLPRPGSKDAHLDAMIRFTELSGSASRRTMALRNLAIAYPAAEIDYQDYQVLQWVADLPPLDLHQLHSDRPAQLGRPENTTLFLAAVLHARGHQLRNLIYRPVLYSCDRIRANKRHAQLAVNISKESVRLLMLLNRTTTFICDETLFFQDFLIAAFGALLLAVSNVPEEFSRQLKDEFFDVLNLCKQVRHKSHNTFRTWNTVKRFEAIAPKLGLGRRKPMEENLERGIAYPSMQSGYHDASSVAAFDSTPPEAPSSSLNEYNGPSSDINSSVVPSWLYDDPHTMCSGLNTFGNELDMLCDPNGDIARILSSCGNLDLLPVDPSTLSETV